MFWKREIGIFDRSWQVESNIIFNYFLRIYIFTCQPKNTPRKKTKKKEKELLNVLISRIQPSTDGPISPAMKTNQAQNIQINNNLNPQSPSQLKPNRKSLNQKKKNPKGLSKTSEPLTLRKNLEEIEDPWKL